MGNVFRTATTQAILDIIGEHGSKSRFGQLLTEGDAEALAARVVDLFEMTLELRSRTGLLSSQTVQAMGAPKEEQPRTQTVQLKSQALRIGARSARSDSETAAPFPTTVHAAEFTDTLRNRSKAPDIASHTDDSSALNFRLPRSRKSFSEEERQAFLKRR